MPTRSALSLALALVFLTSCAEPRTDTGYVGTWTSSTDWIETRVAIVAHAEGYLTRVSLRTADGKRTLRCDWSGRCDERVEGTLTSTYAFRTWADEETGHVMIESRRTVLVPERREEVQLDELIVSDDGLTLWAHSHERAGQAFPAGRRPKRAYEKYSDRVEDPPSSDRVSSQ